MHTTNDPAGSSTTVQKHRNGLFNRPLIILCWLLPILILTLSTALVQTVLYNNIQETPQPSPLPFINSTHTISIDFSGLQAFPESLRLDFPDDSFTIVTKQVFDPRAGYILRNAADPPGTPEIRLDPDATAADYSYLWAGTNDQYDVVITVNKGQLVATIAGNSKRYVIRQMGDDSYTLTHVYLPGLLSNADDVVIPTDDNNTQASILVDQTSISHVKSFDIDGNSLANQDKSADNTVLDVLIVYTETARIEAGGAIGNPDDRYGTRYYTNSG
ncbi:MAG: hypothetical protein L3J53_01405 [Proteobacteria bacterium]|nr:hypothetical protein [Pseudomonadota bacterium]